MTDTPEDIDRTATDIVRAPFPADEDPEWFLYKAIAEALMAERERCAKIAEEMWDQMAEDVAAAIRSPDTGPST